MSGTGCGGVAEDERSTLIVEFALERVDAVERKRAGVPARARLDKPLRTGGTAADDSVQDSIRIVRRRNRYPASSRRQTDVVVKNRPNAGDDQSGSDRCERDRDGTDRGAIHNLQRASTADGDAGRCACASKR